MIYCPKCGEATGWLGPSDYKRKIARLTEERDEAREVAREPCVWTERTDPDYWDTQCGEAYTVIEGTIKENGIRYCPFCGKSVATQHENTD